MFNRRLYQNYIGRKTFKTTKRYRGIEGRAATGGMNALIFLPVSDCRIPSGRVMESSLAERNR